MALEKHPFATIPTEEPLGSHVRGSQMDKRSGSAGSSKWPFYDSVPGYSPDEQRLRLGHTREDVDNGVRAFCADVVAA
eukprot:1492283-Alexandrium_andersonii.AAC.1